MAIDYSKYVVPNTKLTADYLSNAGADLASKGFQEPQIEQSIAQYAKNFQTQPTATLRPVNPAPSLVTDPTKTQPATLTDDQIRQGLISKIYKQQYGTSLTDEEAALLARTQAPKFDETGYRAGVDKIIAANQPQVDSAQNDIATRKTAMENDTARRLAEYQASLNAQASEDIARAQQTGTENTATEERLLGAHGNLTTGVGSSRLVNIKNQTEAAINSIKSAATAKYELEKAREQGVDAATLKGLQDRYDTLNANQTKLKTDLETNLQNAKIKAQQEGQAAEAKMYQDLLDGIAKNKANNTKEVAGKLYEKQSDGTWKEVAGTGEHSPAYKEYQDAVSSGYKGDFNQYQNEDANRKVRAAKALSGGLDIFTASRVDRIANQFDNEQIVKDYNQIIEAHNLVQSIPNDTKSSTDDQALIYAFAKAMDPGSVVREGEYSTVQKYSQSWLQSFGFNAARVLSNQEFLSKDAIQNIKDTVKKKVDAVQIPYKNLSKEYGRRINRITNNTDGEDYLSNYTGGVNNQSNNSTGLQSAYEKAGFDIPYDQAVQQYGEEGIKKILKDNNISFNEPLSMGVNGSAEKIAQAIKQVESNGNYLAKGQSGESGAYQFMPATWKAWAKQYLGDAKAPLTQQNQDKVAIAKINDLLAQGYSPREIALIWNGGQPIEKKGVNSKGVKYDSGVYANKVISTLSNLG